MVTVPAPQFSPTASDGVIGVHVWAVKLPGDGDGMLALEQRLLRLDAPPERPGSRLLADRVRSLAGQAALRGLVAELTGRDPRTVALDRDPRGRPILLDRPDLRASVSHSGAIVMCAVGGLELGVDVELHDRPEADEPLARRVCTRAEQELLDATPDELRPAALIRLWVRKEALAKALGVGLELPMGCVDVRRRTPMINGVPRPAWSLQDIESSPGYLAAIATSGPRAGVRTTHLTASALPAVNGTPAR